MKVPYFTMRYIPKNKNSKKIKKKLQTYSRITEELGVEIKQVIYKMCTKSLLLTAISLKRKNRNLKIIISKNIFVYT